MLLEQVQEVAAARLGRRNRSDYRQMGLAGTNLEGVEGRNRTSQRCSWAVIASALVLALVWGSVPPGLHSNAAPCQTAKLMFELVMMTSARSKATAENHRTPPNETATEAATVTFSPKTVVKWKHRESNTLIVTLNQHDYCHRPALCIAFHPDYRERAEFFETTRV
jgi:hypothetical protein